MKSRAETLQKKADECERAAARVADPHVQASYRRMSRQWHEMAERQRVIDEALADVPKTIGIESSAMP
jgi:hypothetical protein